MKIISFTSIQIETKNPSEDWLQAKSKKSKIYTAIFTKLHLMFHLDNSNKWSWDFKGEPFPFCKSCRREISVLCKLQDQLNIIQKQISKIVAKLSVLTIECKGIEDKVKERTNVGNSVNEPGDNFLRGRKAGNKYEYFRRGIIRRYIPNLVLEDCKSDLTSTEGVTDVTDAPEERNVSKDGNGIKIREDIFQTSGSCEGEVVDEFFPPTPLARDGEMESFPVSPAGSLPVEDTIGTGRCSISKEPKPNLPHHMTGLHSEESKEQIYAVSSQNECEKNAFCSGISPKKPHTLYSRRKSRSANARGPNGKVEWLEGNQYIYLGLQFTVDKDKVSCLECNYQAVPGKDVYSGIKWHIRGHIFAKERSSSGDFSSRKIKLIDEATKTYSLGGFEFTENDKEHFRCSTCTRLIIRSWKVERLKYCNIRGHIKTAHMETHRGVCSICKEYKKNLPHHMENMHSQTSNKRVCETCGKEFKNPRLLYKHRQTHKDPSEFKNQCDRCGKKFRGKDQLICHMRTHTGERPFVCEKCGRQFAFRGVYQTHLASHEKIRPFACTQCEWTFGAKFLLTRHIKQVHQGIKPPPARKRKKVVS